MLSQRVGKIVKKMSQIDIFHVYFECPPRFLSFVLFSQGWFGHFRCFLQRCSLAVRGLRSVRSVGAAPLLGDGARGVHGVAGDDGWCDQGFLRRSKPQLQIDLLQCFHCHLGS